MWQPTWSQEQEHVRRLKMMDSEDPDMDGILAAVDKCPEEKGTVENNGCPEQDKDKDGTPDRLDKCPDTAGGNAREGCPSAFRKDDEIVILDPVHFATDKDIILPDSTGLLDQVVEVLKNSPDIRELEIEGHTDVRASDAYNFNLSQRRVENIRMYMIGKGIEPDRLTAKGYGHSKPIYDDSACNAPDEKLSEDCKFMTSKNRRVVFRIKRFGAPQSHSLDGGAPILGPSGPSLPKGESMGSSNPLGGGGTVFPQSQSKDPILGPNKGALPDSKSVLPSGSSGLPKSDTGLPKSGDSVPPPSSGESSGLPSSGGGLQSSGTPAPKTTTTTKPKSPPPSSPTPSKPR